MRGTQVFNTTTGQGAPSVDAYFSNNNIAAEGYADRSCSITLPDGLAGVGDFLITVTADLYYGSSSLYELNANGDAESNNTGAVSFTSTLASYPNSQMTDATMTIGNDLTSTTDRVADRRTVRDYLTVVSTTLRSSNNLYNHGGLRHRFTEAKGTNLIHLRDMALLARFDDIDFLDEMRGIFDDNGGLANADGGTMERASDYGCLDEAFAELLKVSV